jgi:hypothetical protein
MTHRLLYNPHLHTSQMFEAMVEALTRDPAVLPTFDFKPPATQPFAKFNPAPGEAAEVDALLRRENPAVGSAPLILLNPNASDLLPLRRWPPMRYVELSRRLLERYPDLFIAFTGAPAEATANNRLAAEVSSNRVISLAGKTTLRQVLVLYTRSQILVTNDSGPAHFASMTPIHVITLFGPETPALFGARSSKCNCALGWHCVQSVRQRLQQSAIGMSQQPLHANNHCGRSLREGDKHLRFAKGRGCQRCEGKMESYVTFDIFVGAPRRRSSAPATAKKKKRPRYPVTTGKPSLLGKLIRLICCRCDTSCSGALQSLRGIG